MYVNSCDRGRLMKFIRFDIICNITQEPRELQRFNCDSGFIGKSTAIKLSSAVKKYKYVHIFFI